MTINQKLRVVDFQILLHFTDQHYDDRGAHASKHTKDTSQELVSSFDLGTLTEDKTRSHDKDRPKEAHNAAGD